MSPTTPHHFCSSQAIYRATRSQLASEPTLGIQNKSWRCRRCIKRLLACCEYRIGKFCRMLVRDTRQLSWLDWWMICIGNTETYLSDLEAEALRKELVEQSYCIQIWCTLWARTPVLLPSLTADSLCNNPHKLRDRSLKSLSILPPLRSKNCKNLAS